MMLTNGPFDPMPSTLLGGQLPGQHRTMTEKVSVSRRRASARDTVREFNKFVTNPIMMLFAGRKHWYASVIRHTGRRTGRHYATPVVAEPIPSGFIVPLPYGTEVDWLRNVQSAGTADIQRAGRTYRVTAPAIIDAATAEALLTPQRRRQFRRLRIDHFLTLRLADDA